MLKKTFLTELPAGIRLLPDERIDLAFEREKKKNSDYVIFTNKRLITNERALTGATSFMSIPYSAISYYTVNIKDSQLWINLLADPSLSSLILKFNEFDILEAEHILAKNICN